MNTILSHLCLTISGKFLGKAAQNISYFVNDIFLFDLDLNLIILHFI